MIDLCIRLIKKHPYLLIGVVGIGLIFAPLVIYLNFFALCEFNPGVSDAALHHPHIASTPEDVGIIPVRGSGCYDTGNVLGGNGMAAITKIGRPIL